MPKAFSPYGTFSRSVYGDFFYLPLHKTSATCCHVGCISESMSERKEKNALHSYQALLEGSIMLLHSLCVDQMEVIIFSHLREQQIFCRILKRPSLLGQLYLLGQC